jgi:hypothetical protein
MLYDKKYNYSNTHKIKAKRNTKKKYKKIKPNTETKVKKNRKQNQRKTNKSIK